MDFHFIILITIIADLRVDTRAGLGSYTLVEPVGAVRSEEKERERPNIPFVEAPASHHTNPQITSAKSVG